MKKEIGSIFPLSDEAISKAESGHVSYSGNRLFYSLCREALFDIAKAIDVTERIVFIPAYTCQSVITPFEEAGWRCEYYPITSFLRIDVRNLTEMVKKWRPSLIIVHPYFGMDLDEIEISLLINLRSMGVIIVLDLTQCLFSTKLYSFPSFIVGSYRKWMPLPDGGYLQILSDDTHIIQPEKENDRFVENEIAAMYLRGQYFIYGEQRMKAISIRLSKMADAAVKSGIVPHRMSQIAYNLLYDHNIECNKRIRYSNYEYLFSAIQERRKIKKVCNSLKIVTTAPLYFPIYVKDRHELQSKLAQDAIYAPVIWPVEDDRVLINDEVKYIYDHLLAIPCDQRYDIMDMKRVVEIVNNY